MSLDKVHPDCREFVRVVEELLKRRQEQIDDLNAPRPSWRQEAWGPRAWTICIASVFDSSAKTKE